MREPSGLRWCNMEIPTRLHSALLVSDMQRGKEFYAGVLALKEEPRHSLDFDGVWYHLGKVLILTASWFTRA